MRALSVSEYDSKFLSTANGGLVTCGAQEPAVLARIIDVARESEPLPASADDEEAALAASLIGDVGLS